ncbi:50S ribosomal protein 6 chloroplastic [Quillaja saponaria]|uniref:50S ribosomal protein 6 chloroplastic n=1 Tax=Quillaja saponaria TaxID=32244 RepID=A0AAD7LX18_QUISA|nr:50S ribosomal protein 6 chloroplastic [Quillaja saponaria]
MMASAIFGSRMVMVPNYSAPSSFGIVGGTKAVPRIGGSGCGLMIECSSRPTKKATAHHRKTRPRKSQPWDIKRKPTVYPPLPPLPPDWTLVSEATVDVEIEPSSPSPQETPTE